MKQAAEKTGNRLQIVRTISTLLRLICKLDPAYFGILALSALSRSGASILTIYIPRILIDGYGRGWTAGHFAGVISLLVAGRYLRLQVFALRKRQDKIHRETLQQRFVVVFADKVMKLDYACLEDPSVLDLKERALFPVTSYGAVYGLLDSFLLLVTGLVTLAGVLVILVDFDPWFTALVLVLGVVSMLLNKRFMATFKSITERLIPINRRYGYYLDTTTKADFQKEFRLYGMSETMNRKIGTYTEEIRRWLHQIYVVQANTRTGQAVVTALTRFVTYSAVALRILTDHLGPRISLGSFSVIVGATESFAVNFAGVTDAVMNVIQNAGFLAPFCEFLELPESSHVSGTGMPGPLQTLTFENVCFAYPKHDRRVLDNVSFQLKKGEKISIVGLNNAGKSTIVKLICRLFEPDSGRILWNDSDIRELNYDAYTAALSCIFQDFQLFPFSIGENIAADKTESEISEEAGKIRQVLRRVGILDDIEALPHGLATRMDKALYEDATDLSGGQKQKLAIARAVYKKAELIILDEPTAALDPLAEAEVYEHFHELTEGHTAIFISHRMSSSTFCDRILLLHDGKVAACDSHGNLMRGHNLYRDLFETQARHYRDKAD